MQRKMKGREEFLQETFVIIHKRGDEVAVCLAVETQSVRRDFERTVQVKSRSVLKRMRKGYFGMYPGEAVPLKVEGSKERRGNGQSVDCGADIVDVMG
jgi:hypothetical protein